MIRWSAVRSPMSRPIEARRSSKMRSVLSMSRVPTNRFSAKRVAQGQAGYYILTGLWPFVSRRTFEAVTGRKQDFWLVQTVGALVGVTGAALATAAADQRSLGTPAIRMLGVGSAL